METKPLSLSHLPPSQLYGLALTAARWPVLFLRLSSSACWDMLGRLQTGQLCKLRPTLCSWAGCGGGWELLPSLQKGPGRWAWRGLAWGSLNMTVKPLWFALKQTEHLSKAEGPVSPHLCQLCSASAARDLGGGRGDQIVGGRKGEGAAYQGLKPLRELDILSCAFCFSIWLKGHWICSQ